MINQNVDEKKQLFGISLSAASVPAENVPDYLHFAHLKAMELPAEVLLSEKFRHDNDAALNALDFLCAGNPADDSLLDAIVHAPLKQQIDFMESLRPVLHRLSDGGIHMISLKFNMQDILKDQETAEALAEVLHLLAPSLEKEKIILLLPFRIPSSVISAGEFSLFLRRVMIPNIRCRLEIHSDELQKMPEVAHWESLLFETELFDFVYDADAGSKVPEILIKKCMEWKTRFCEPVPVLFSPESVHGRMAFTAAQVIEETAASFSAENNQPGER